MELDMFSELNNPELLKSQISKRINETTGLNNTSKSSILTHITDAIANTIHDTTSYTASVINSTFTEFASGDRLTDNATEFGVIRNVYADMYISSEDGIVSLNTSDSMNFPRVSYVGNFKKFFDELKRTFGIILHSNEGVNGVASNGKKAEVVQGLTFMFANNQVPAVINKATKPYQKISSPDLTKDLFQEDVQDDIVTIFNYETGLLESPKVEYKIQKVPEDWKFNRGEEQTFESQVRQQNQNIKAAEAASKRAEREKKAKEKGKVLKPQKPKKKGTISIKRKFLKAKTLINADVRPRSLVQIESIIAENNGVYRVHSVTFTANNTSSSYMELQLESVDDTETQLTEQEEQELQESQSSNGELGNEAQVGSTGDYE